MDFFENVLGDATKTEKESEVASLFPVRPFRSVFVFSPLFNSFTHVIIKCLFYSKFVLLDVRECDRSEF